MSSEHRVAWGVVGESRHRSPCDARLVDQALARKQRTGEGTARRFFYAAAGAALSAPAASQGFHHGSKPSSRAMTLALM
jgi:hypothetical protein